MTDASRVHDGSVMAKMSTCPTLPYCACGVGVALLVGLGVTVGVTSTEASIGTLVHAPTATISGPAVTPGASEIEQPNPSLPVPSAA